MTKQNKEENDKKKRELFEKVWDNYWWKRRVFSYRINNSESSEREIISLALESWLEEIVK